MYVLGDIMYSTYLPLENIIYVFKTRNLLLRSDKNMSPTQRTSIELYRDLLRLIAHIAPGSSPKSTALRTMVRSEFERSRILLTSDGSPADRRLKIEATKANAIRVLSNYMLYEGGIQDRNKGGKLGAAMDDYHMRNVRGMRGSTATTTGDYGGGGKK